MYTFMDVLIPKFEISVPGLLRKRQTALFLLLFSRKRSLRMTVAGAIVPIRISSYFSPNRKCMGIFHAYL